MGRYLGKRLISTIPLLLVRSGINPAFLSKPGMASNQWTGNLEELYSSITYNGSRNHGRTCQILQIFHA